MTTVEDELNLVVPAAVAGDHRAVARLLEVIRQPVVRYCRARIGLRDQGRLAADDVAQEVCMAVLTALPNYSDRGRPFLAFVYGIASHKVADAFRSSGRNKTTSLEFAADVVDCSPSPEERALSAESTRDIRALLGCLSPRDQEIVRLRVLVGLSATETAEAMGSTAGAVRVAQHRALNRLRTLWESEEKEERND